MRTTERLSLSGLLPEEISELLTAEPRYRSVQIFEWIHAKRISSFSGMTTLPSRLREELSSSYHVRGASLHALLQDPGDETIKAQVRLQDGQIVEAVVLTDGKGRKTACLSTQAGCAMGCAFCKTGQLGFSRNLTPGEIVDQWLILQDAAGPLSHIVFMGMGEPLLNLANLRKAISILSHERGSRLSLRRITVSTCGIVPGILSLAEEGPHVRLAFSLTSARPEVRKQLMPVEARHPLDHVKEALLRYQAATGKRITLEVVAIEGLTCTPEESRAIAGFAEGLRVLVNVIPWNPVPGLPYRPPSPAALSSFVSSLTKKALTVTVRYRKGQHIHGACGQLGVVTPRKTHREAGARP